MKRTVALVAALLLLVPATAAADGAPALPAKKLDLASYLADVVAGNWDLAAARTGIAVADAQIGIAKTFPDPVLTGGLQQVDVTGQPNPTGTMLALSLPVQIGGQRGSRIDVATTGKQAAEADANDAQRTLRATAKNAYVDALHARLVLDRKKRTQASVERIVAVNEVRLQAGDVAQTAFIQSRIEAAQFQAQVLAADGDVRARDLALVVLLGKNAPSPPPPLELSGDLAASAQKSFMADALVADALAKRPDLIAAKRRVDQAKNAISLARSNRVPDVTFSAFWQHNFPLAGATPLPSSDWLGATLSIPIPFSLAYRGALDEAIATQVQTDQTTKSLALRIETEVRQALVAYDAAAARVKVYVAGGVLSDADALLEKSFYNYQRGGSNFVEVLVAQRTVNDVYLAYYDAIADAAHALVALEQAAASDDLPF